MSIRPSKVRQEVFDEIKDRLNEEIEAFKKQSLEEVVIDQKFMRYEYFINGLHRAYDIVRIVELGIKGDE